MLEITGLTQFRHDYPAQLSGGMAQRVALVRTLINEPEILLLDEPLGALDEFTRMNMQDEILNIWMQKSSLLSWLPTALTRRSIWVPACSLWRQIRGG